MKKKKIIACFGISLLFLGHALLGQKNSGSDRIRLNQVGFFPTSKKVAIVVNTNESQFCILSASNKKDTVYSGALKKAGVWEYSKEEISQADFSKLTKPGTYVVAVKGLANSYSFEIKNNVYEKVAKASIKGYYYQRASMELTEEFAGVYARAAGHMDTEVLVHNSAASSSIPANTVINSSRGWYDAGDYNKYIVNSGISMATLFASYEDFPTYFKSLSVDIPESKNQLPDIIDEINWNLRWMLTMQDPYDGGVYHKLTNSLFDGVVQPKDANETRYVIIKTTSATLDFAATMAHAFRIFKEFGKQCPGLADSCLKASKKAYDWAKKNPTVLYTNATQDGLKNPVIKTGAYEDDFVEDEFFWAAAELFVSTQELKYYADLNLAKNASKNLVVPNWQRVGMLGVYSLVKNADKCSVNPEVKVALDSLKQMYINVALTFRDKANASPYGVVMGLEADDFVWGSNAIAGNQSVFLIKAYLLSKDTSLLEAAATNLDYLLGRNATGYCFVTGFGKKSTLHPHHRPSESDDIVKPIPGLLAGGPNPGQQDLMSCGEIHYPSKLPAMSYLDAHCSYASNEIAINWNAPLVYCANALEALNKK